LIRRSALIAGAVLACLLAGWLLDDWLVPRAEFNAYGQLVAYPGKREIARPPIGPHTMVAFVFGQSNSANHGNAKFRATSDAVANFWDGRYFAAEDPLLGASGEGGGPWVRMADKLIASRTFGEAILIAAGVGATSVQEWTVGGRLNGMLETRLAEAKDAGLSVTHFLWHQGESDNTTIGAATYDTAMQPIIELTRRYFPKSKFFVAQATICGQSATPFLELQKIQRGLTRLPDVFAGPNTDDIGLPDRFDTCHMSEAGLEKHAAGWAAAIAAHMD